MSLVRRPQYRLATLFVLIGVLSIPLGVWTARERAYRERALAARVLLEGDDEIDVEPLHGGANSCRATLLGASDDPDAHLSRDDVVVGVECGLDLSGRGFERQLAAILTFPTLKSLTIYEAVDLSSVPVGPPVPFGPAAYIPEVPLGAIDPPLREIAKLPALEYLCIRSTSVSDNGVRALAPLRTLRKLNLAHTRISDAALEHLSAFPRLEMLNLDRTAVTDAGVCRLEAVQTLRELSLRNTKVAGVGFAKIASLRKLEKLDLYDTNVGDDGVADLAAVTSLRILNLGRPRFSDSISDEASLHIAKLARLEQLSLGGPAVGDESMRRFAALPKLVFLTISGSRMSDVGLATISQSSSLEHLELRECSEISDSGVLNLSELSSLQRLVLFHNKRVTEGVVARLKSLRPDLHVDWSPPPYRRARKRS